MSIDELAEKFETLKELEQDIDMTALRVVDGIGERRYKWRDYMQWDKADPVEFVGSMTEGQKRAIASLDFDRARVMVQSVRPEHFEAYAEIWKKKSYDNPFSHSIKETCAAYAKLTDEEKSQIKKIGDDEAFMIRELGAIGKEPLYNLSRKLGNYRTFSNGKKHWVNAGIVVPEYKHDSDALGKFLRQFDGLEEEAQELTAKGMKHFRSEFNNEDWKEIHANWEGNPYRYAAVALYLTIENDYAFFTKDDHVTGDPAFCRAMYENRDHLDFWLELDEHAISFGMQNYLFNTDPSVIARAEEIAQYVKDSDDRYDMRQGLLDNIKDGTAEQWTEYVLAQVRKGTVGGGNYRSLFEREVA